VVVVVVVIVIVLSRDMTESVQVRVLTKDKVIDR
jgi:hypothetical protein